MHDEPLEVRTFASLQARPTDLRGGISSRGGSHEKCQILI